MVELILFFLVCIYLLFLFFAKHKIKEIFTLINSLPKVQENRVKNGPPIGSKAANFSLQTITGELYTLDHFLNSHSFFLVIHEKCSLCSRHINDFVTASETSYFKNYNFVIISVGTNFDETLKDFSLPILKADSKFLFDYNLKLYPTFIYINQKGLVGGIPPYVNEFKNLVPTF
ncbi:AhpC/TSA family protein [Cytobacillus firmus]|uniref:AhpC/TSA family protein n=2 Tax=Cytobacillus TaxID=2675230 RepID=A0A366JHT9_CYTFI|nr:MULTISPECIES: redoxin domain-containing protein [Cytobacillus]RBP86583.1 AhpC/TSA family protein [Cytobacillus firmus]TDX39323.1 AhpC/TSA family protein [Cytobacillus oceanisediminis]